MAAEIVTLLVAATLLVLVVAMFRQRDAATQGRQSKAPPGGQVWNASATGNAARPPSGTGIVPPRDPAVAGREVMEHLRRLEERSPGLIAQVIPVFLKDTSARLATLKDAVQQRDGVAAHRVAHTLHGSAASVGAASMVRACAEIIREVRLGAFDGCDRLIGELDADFESIRRASDTARPGDAA